MEALLTHGGFLTLNLNEEIIYTLHLGLDGLLVNLCIRSEQPTSSSLQLAR